MLLQFNISTNSSNLFKNVSLNISMTSFKMPLIGKQSFI